MKAQPYDPPASELVTPHAVADRLGVRHHTVNQAIRQGYLWHITLDGHYATTWTAVGMWQRGPHYYGPKRRKKVDA